MEHDRKNSPANAPEASTSQKSVPLPPIGSSQESVLLTASQLQLPTLSALRLDLESRLEDFRPKEIVRKDTPHGQLAPNEKRSVEATRDESWDLPQRLLNGFPDLPISDLAPKLLTPEVWVFEGLHRTLQTFVQVFVGRKTLTRQALARWDECRPVLTANQSISLPEICFVGKLIGGFPVLVFRKMEGQLLTEIQAGMTVLSPIQKWTEGNGEILVRISLGLLDSLVKIHSLPAHLNSMSWFDIYLNPSDRAAKLSALGVAESLFANLQKEASELQSRQRTDCENFSRFLIGLFGTEPFSRALFDELQNCDTNEIKSSLERMPNVSDELKQLLFKGATRGETNNPAQADVFTFELGKCLNGLVAPPPKKGLFASIMPRLFSRGK